MSNKTNSNTKTYEVLKNSEGFYDVYGLAYFARVQTPADEFKLDNGDTIPERYIMQLALDKRGVEAAEDLCLNIKEPKDEIPYPHISLVRRTKGDKEKAKPSVKYEGAEYSGLVGNGSKAKVRIGTYDTKYGFNGATLLDVEILNLVEPPKDFDKKDSKKK